MNNKFVLLLILFVALSVVGGGIYLFMNDSHSYSTDQPERIINGITIREIAQLTGQDSVNKTDERYDVAGTDLGSIFDMDGTYYYVFGDTFGKGSVLPPGSGDTTNWRSNVVAYSTDDDPADGIVLDGFIDSDITGVAIEIIPANKIDGDHITSIPTYGVAVGGTMYLYYMAVDTWGDPGVWDVAYSGVYRSTDKGETWEAVDGLEWDGDSHFHQVAIVKPEQNESVLGDDIYFYGVGEGRYSPIQLMKVNQDDIEDKGEYEYFTGVDADGRPQWSSNEEEAINILDTTAGELSVVYNEGIDRWIMTYMNGTTTNIDLVEAENPWGPWTEPTVMVAQADDPGLYGSYMHPSFIKDDGRSIYFTMSRWGEYNVFIMKAELDVSD